MEDDLTRAQKTDEVHVLLGSPKAGGVLVVADHASNRVPDDIDLGIDAALLARHIAIDIGVAEIAGRMVRSGVAAWLGNVSRLVCDFNRDPGAPGIVPEASDGHTIAGNMLTPKARDARIGRFYTPYHDGLADLLALHRPALILSLHSFTPSLATSDRPRPWEVGVLYNEDERAARLALDWLGRQNLVVGDQEPYSGKLLNATMNRHAERSGIPYVGIEIRQDLVGDEAGCSRWAELMDAMCRHVLNGLLHAK